MYLFGSTVKQADNKKKRDTDIAVLLNKIPTGMDGLDFRTKLVDELKFFFDTPIDLVVLNSSPVALKQQVLKYGKLLYERNEGVAKKFFIETVTEYFDYLEILKFFADRLQIKRGKNG